MTIEPRADEALPGEENSDAAVFSLAAAPGFHAGKAGCAFAAARSGLRRSEDGGQTWTDGLADLALSGPLPITSLAVSPAYDHDGLVFAGTAGGILHSIRGGPGWKTVVFPPPSPSVSALAISPNFTEDETLFAGTIEDGVFVSRDSGEQWYSWNFGLLDLNVLALAASPNFKADDTVFAGTETGLFRSTSGGRAWREVELPFGYDPVISLALSPRYGEDHRLYIGCETRGLWVSSDEGDHWLRLAEGNLPDAVNSILVSGSDLVAATGDGLWQAVEDKTQWISRLPRQYQALGITAVLAPQGTGPGSALLVGFADGSVHPVTLSST